MQIPKILAGNKYVARAEDPAYCRAMKRESALTGGIAAVIMAFLPATFVATFFSMVFFHVDDDHFVIDSGIWMYAAVALPLTAGIALWYRAWSSGWRWPSGNRQERGSTRNAIDVDDDAYNAKPVLRNDRQIAVRDQQKGTSDRRNRSNRRR